MAPSGPKPKHAALRDILLAIAQPGRAIPSERELMVAHQVSRATVRKAIDTLVADGLLQRVPGVGTFAVQPRLATRLHLASFSQDMTRRGRSPSTRLLSLGREVPPPWAAQALGLAPQALAWRLRRVRLADLEPIAQEDGWYPLALFPDLDRHDLGSGSLYELLGTAYGRWADRADQLLWGEAADASVAADLSAPAGSPLLVFQRTTFATGVPIEAVTSRYRGDRYQIEMNLSRNDPA